MYKIMVIFFSFYTLVFPAYNEYTSLPTGVTCELTGVISINSGKLQISSECKEYSIYGQTSDSSVSLQIYKVRGINFSDDNPLYACEYERLEKSTYRCTQSNNPLSIACPQSTDEYLGQHYVINNDCTTFPIENGSVDTNGNLVCDSGFDIYNNQCIQGSKICSDDGPAIVKTLSDNSLYYNCDRSCEEVSMIEDSDTGKCVDTLSNNCEQQISSCQSKCGDLGIKNFECNTDTGVVTTPCECNPDPNGNIDIQPDPDPNSDSDLTSSILTDIKDEDKKQTEKLGDIESLLNTQNESDTRKETLLNSIDGKMTNLNDGIDGVKNSIDSVKDSVDGVKNSVDGLNSNLSSLKDINNTSNEHLSNIADSNNGILDKLTEFYDFLLMEILNFHLILIP